MTGQQTTRPVSESDRPKVVLEFRHVTLGTERNSWPISDISFQVCEKQLMLVRLEEGREDLRIMSAAQGLVDDQQGQVLFQDLDWATCDSDRNEARRGLIGRVFRRWGWVTNLTVEENVTLAQRQHTRRPIDEIKRDMNDWARRMGLDPVPDEQPAKVPRRVLRCYQWVRALYARPKLLLLEQPMDDVVDRRLPNLVDGVLELVNHGSAAVWLTTEYRVWHHPALAGTSRYVMKGMELRQETGAAG